MNNSLELPARLGEGNLSNKSRIAWLDACRGFTMVLVVYFHITMYVFDSFSLVTQYLAYLRMPTFLFISGYFTYSAFFPKETAIFRTKKRLVRQLLPTILFYVVTIYLSQVFLTTYTNHVIVNKGEITLLKLLLHPSKYGFWFTFILVELFLFVAPILYLFHRFKVRKIYQTLTFLSIALTLAVTQGYIGLLCLKFPFDYLSGLLNFPDLFLHSPSFFIGMAASVNKEFLFKLCKNKVVWICGFLFYCILASINATHPWEIDALYFICCAFGIIVALGCFYRLSLIRNAWAVKLQSCLIYIGGFTLEIYLLHYIFLFVIRYYWLSSDSFKLFHDTINTPWEIPIMGILSILLVAAIIATIHILKALGIYKFLFPNVSRPAKKAQPATLETT